MPIYEYCCQNCDARFEERRPMADADEPIPCPNCGGQESRRALSLFSAIGSRGVIAGAGSSCDACSSGSCAGCASKR